MAFNKALPTVENVNPNVTATLKIPVENLTLLGILLRLGGTTFDKTKINWIKVLVGTKTIWDLTMAELDKVNGYKNSFSNNAFVLLDFAERDQAIFPVKEAGGLDLMALLGVGQVIVQINIASSAVAPTIDATGIYTRNQGNPFVLKFKREPFSRASAGEPVLPLQPRGAVMKRVWLDYSGTDWTSTANGNVSKVVLKKNGFVTFERTDLENRIMQAHYKKVPQSRMYVIDFLEDNNHDAHVQTVSNQKTNSGVLSVYDNFELKATIGDAGGSNIDVITEVLDSIANL
jgi:hypothetical protein